LGAARGVGSGPREAHLDAFDLMIDIIERWLGRPREAHQTFLLRGPQWSSVFSVLKP
jgi:hypothetical protein